ncbi:guanine deaminase isoform X2 [Eurytemora carolleeae]|uniref:guanine deaminase isoform X2 n=1 Tax=Eurytemora carolleeae TaxID=1294199 RepID=UPI000C758579|nr:guanine deaminase isoform X2 [Eurytemora carolleeae]|eukprot:XP_023325491.1 guanine deaminase-like isoform X2 [Eurytemora affinis]
MTMTEVSQVYVGYLVESRKDWSLNIEQGVLVIQQNRIVFRAKVSELEYVLEKYNVARNDVTVLSSSQFLMPGLIDTHIHASQFPNAGLALELPLLDWLEKYTFPTEAKFSRPEFSVEVYNRCVRATLDSGTTTAAYFATIHRESSEILAKVCLQLGQRAFVGKVCMDRNSPDYYVEKTEESLAETQAFVNKISELGGSLVNPIITPRFVPSCSRLLMSELGRIAKEKNLHIQTHLSENKKEVEWVRELESDCQTYAQVYEKCGLLTRKTILAHAVHLSDQELETISLKSGVCDVRRMKNKGVKVGLGTDCSGGYSSSIINSMRLSVLASNSIKLSKELGLGEGAGEGEGEGEGEGSEYIPLDYADSVYLATLGGAQLLDMEENLGSLEPGKLADFLLVDMQGKRETTPFGHESIQNFVHKFVFLGDDRNIVLVVVDGKIVKDIRNMQNI